MQFSRDDKVLFFDFDGTLADSFEESLKAYNKTAKEMFLPVVDHAEIEKFREKGIKSWLKEKRIGLIRTFLLVKKTKKRLKNRALPRIFPGLKSELESLRKTGFQMGIVTSNSEGLVVSSLESWGVRELFSFLITDVSLFGKQKPIRKFILKNNLSPRNCILIGDESRDMNSARDCGIKSVAVLWGYEDLGNFQGISAKVSTPVDLARQIENVFLLSRP